MNSRNEGSRIFHGLLKTLAERKMGLQGNNGLCSDMHRWPLRWKKPDVLLQTKTLLIVVASLALWTQNASAACGSSAQRILPSVLAAQPLPFLQESPSDNTPDREPRSGDKHPSITGLWKTVYVSGGAVINVGFNIWHSDGTEWALDSIAPPFQGNTCAGAWEQIGRRTYRTVHPAFNYDAAGMSVVGIFIERVKVTVSADASRFEGTFTFDNYDFQGNLLSGSVAGTVSATRIKVEAPFPFPIPH